MFRIYPERFVGLYEYTSMVGA
uniref:Uncharacterized protein n=1 Tax=Arundo donax TaxID=35708 RepID=A0A0A9BFL5_ARUDO